MATYASATNPFIKPSETLAANGGPGQRQQAKKNAPGMARPLSLLDELGTSKKENAENLLDEPVAGLPSSGPKPDTLDPLDRNNNTNTDNEANKEEDPLAKIELDENDITDAVAQTCNHLVQQAVNMSISEGSLVGENHDEPIDNIPEQNRDPLVQVKDGDLTKNSSQEREESESSDKAVALQSQPPRCTQIEEEEDEEDEEENMVASNDKKKLAGEAPAEPRYSSGRQQHIELIKKLRLQLRDLERYAHERGELEQMPASVLLERQTVILESLRKKLPNFSLDKDKIEKLELDELKKQVDDEINNLIDPLLTQEHLLNQLKSQLTDLEKYVSHLHGTIGISDGGDCLKSPSSALRIRSASQDSSKKQLDCRCALHGCSSQASAFLASSPPSPTASSRSSSSALSGLAGDRESAAAQRPNILSSDTLPKTSRLIRGLMAQLICSDVKIQEAMRIERDINKCCRAADRKSAAEPSDCESEPAGPNSKGVITTKPPQFHDGAAWTLHVDRVILATDSLNNIYSLASSAQGGEGHDTTARRAVDHSLVESVVRRQLVPAIRDLLAYGLIDPSSLPPKSGFASLIFDPYYILSSLTCLPGYRTTSDSTSSAAGTGVSGTLDKVHVWQVIADYHESRNEPGFRNSSVRTLSQSFNLTSTMDGPIKITSKQALLIAIDDIIERMTKCKPNGPESHFKMFVYMALNQGKLATWMRIIFRSKAIIRKYYHNFSFVCQADKMNRFLAVIDSLSRCEFKLNTDSDAIGQFVSAF